MNQRILPLVNVNRVADVLARLLTPAQVEELQEELRVRALEASGFGPAALRYNDDGVELMANGEPVPF